VAKLVALHTADTEVDISKADILFLIEKISALFHCLASLHR
jgi:hypothetical protein